MLATLSIRDIVLIDRLDLDLGRGLTVLTGETGAGKSILLDALGLALGGRGDSALVRHGADKGTVTAQVMLAPGHGVFDLLRANDIDAGESELVLRRVQFADGRSRAFLNDQPISVGLLRQIGSLLAEIHGQHDDRAFLDREVHARLLDAYGVLDGAAGKVERVWHAWKDIEKSLAEHRETVERVRGEREFLEHAVEELRTLDPQPDEETELAARRQTMMNAEKFVDDLREAEDALSSDGTAEARLNAALRRLERKSADAGGALDAAVTSLDRVLVEITEAKRLLSDTLRAVEFDPGELERAEERLFSLRAAARKHRVGVADLPVVLQRLTAQLDAIDNDETKVRELEQANAAARDDYSKHALALSEKRQKAALALSKEVVGELPPLKLEKARFETRVDVLELDQGGPRGVNRVEFMVAANPGADPAPLMKVASGGELARFILALKVVLAARGSAPTLIFDEVDTAVGGAVADAIGARLARLADSLQVLAVTHSPQVAARSMGHVLIAKSSDDDAKDERVTTRVRMLDDTSRLEEIARMLSGHEVTEEARAAAQRLIKGAA